MSKKTEAVVVITIHGAEKMTPAQKKKINNWFRVQGRNIVRDGHNYAKRFTARFF